MKKSTLLLGAALLGAMSMNAQDEVVLANPVLDDGSYVVKYDMDNKKFAETNDFEIDETFVFAIDVTGTPYETAMKESSRNPDVLGRGMAHDFYVNNDVCEFENYKNEGNLDGRLFHIEGNIYGACFNLMQLGQGRYKDGCFGLAGDSYDACQEGAVTVFGANIFGFGWSADNHGAEWWDVISTPIQNLWFTTAPYTGTKTSREFYFDDFTEGPAFEGCEASVYSDKGYAKPEFYNEAIAGVKSITADNANAPVEFFNLQGVRVAEPTSGLYIRRQGTTATKVLVK